MSKEERVYIWNETERGMNVEVDRDENGYIRIHLTSANKLQVLEAGGDHIFDIQAGDD